MTTYTSSADSIISATGKLAYIYDETDNTWYPVAGSVDTTIAPTWSGSHTFASPTTFGAAVVAKSGFNNFTGPTNRNDLMPTPAVGALSFIQSTNEIQYYTSTGWKTYGDNALLTSKTASFTLELANAGKTIEVDSTSSIVITIPKDSVLSFPTGSQISFIRSNTGLVSFQAADNVVTSILSKNNAKKISSQYSSATLIKKSSSPDAWYLIGDLTA